MPRTIRARSRWASIVVPALAVIGLATAGGSARAQQPDDLHRELAEVAKQVKGLLDQKGNDSIAVGDFRGPARLASSAGPAIAKALTDTLQRLGVTVKRRAALEVNGEYRDVEDQKTRLLSVEIKAHVIDRSGAEIVAFEPRGLFSVPLIAALTGVTVALPPRADDKARNKVL